MSYKCNKCNKNYSSYKSLWYHNYKYHSATETPVPPPVPPKNIDYKCNNCNIIFTRKDSLTRHINNKRCKKELKNESKDDEILKLKQLIEKQQEDSKKEMLELKNMLQKALKIHPKTLNKINNQLINQNCNNTMNNTFNIVQLGRENLSDILSSKEKINILNRQAMSLNDLVELIHISGKYKSFQNVYITNLQNSIGYRYDEKQNNFIAVPKSELLADIVDSRMYDIEKFFEEFQQKLEPKKVEQIKKFIERMGNEEDGLKGIKKR